MDDRIGENSNVGKYKPKGFHHVKVKPDVERDHLRTKLVALSRLWMRRVALIQHRDITISPHLEERATKEIQNVEQGIGEILSPFFNWKEKR